MGLLDTLLGHAGEAPTTRLQEELQPILATNEPVQCGFAFVRDLIVFTDRRMILVNKQGISAKKVEYRSIPYRSISMYALETAGHFELDADLKLWLSGMAEPLLLKLGRGPAATRLISLIAQHAPR